MPRFSSWRGARALVVCACLLPVSCAEDSRPRKPNVVLITIDTLRADRLGCYGYFRNTSPMLDHFAQEAILFENAIAPIATTLASHLSLMTSTHPLRHGILANLYYFKQPFDERGGIRTAAQMLSDIGYETAAFVSATPLKAVTGISVGFDTYDEPDTTERRASETTGKVLEWLQQTRDRPFFLWVHYFDPHTLYTPPPPYDEFFPSEPALHQYLIERRFLGAEYGEGMLDMQNRYDGEVRYVDFQVGQLFVKLRDLGFWDEAAVVVTADHGEGLGQHGEISHTVIHNEQIRVPLLVKLPGMDRTQARRERNLVALLDVLPALVDELELPIAAEDRAQFEGKNPLAGKRRSFVFSTRGVREDRFGDSRRFSLLSDRWKMLLTTDAPDELYDLTADPYELDNVVEDHPQVARDYRERILARIRNYESAGDSTAPEIAGEEHREALRTLGYVD